MTIPIERSWAVDNAREFLRSLLDPKKTPRVPAEIRRNARSVLKHFPNEVDMTRARTVAPLVFGSPNEWNKED
jgi:hypothetical protein